MPAKSQTGQARSVRSVLRERTDDIHQLLHRHSSFVALFEQTLDAREYLRLVQRLYGFYAPLDDVVEAITADDVLRDYAYVRRSNLLKRDLLDLGLSHASIEALPLCPQFAHLITPKTLGGALYVVEGATMGGSVIERAVSKTLKTDGPEGRRYWSWCRAEGKQCWSKLITYFDSLDVTDDVLEDHLTGATETFRIFAEWLEPLNQSSELKISA